MLRERNRTQTNKQTDYLFTVWFYLGRVLEDENHFVVTGSTSVVAFGWGNPTCVRGLLRGSCILNYCGGLSVYICQNSSRYVLYIHLLYVR